MVKTSLNAAMPTMMLRGDAADQSIVRARAAASRLSRASELPAYAATPSSVANPVADEQGQLATDVATPQSVARGESVVTTCLQSPMADEQG